MHRYVPLELAITTVSTLELMDLDMFALVFGFKKRTKRPTMHSGDKDFTLDRSIILDMGLAIFLLLFNKVFSISP